MLKFSITTIEGQKGTKVLMEDAQVDKSFSLIVSDDPTPLETLDLMEKTAKAIEVFYLPEGRAMAKDIIKEFVSATPEWIAEMEKIARKGHCPGCGIKPAKMREIANALKLLI